MNNKLFVGNLAYSVTGEMLQRNFSEFGTVISASVLMDRETGRSKGFGFVEMSTDQEAQAAIQGLNGVMAEGRALTVNVARPPSAKPGFGSDRPRNFGGGGGYGRR